jgi:hypothetical protein
MSKLRFHGEYGVADPAVWRLTIGRPLLLGMRRTSGIDRVSAAVFSGRSPFCVLAGPGAFRQPPTRPRTLWVSFAVDLAVLRSSYILSEDDVITCRW